MEKKRNLVGTGGLHPGLTKLIKIMKLTTFLFFFAIAQVFAVSSYSQVTRLSLDMENVTVKDVLFEIEDNSEFYFIYSNKLIDVERKVDVKVNNQKVQEVLDQIFLGEDVSYTINNRQIIISPKGMVLKNSGNIFGQQRKITGMVKSQNGESLPGVTVVVKGTSNGTVTNADGTFDLNVEAGAETLVFSFVGMKTQEISIGSQTVFDLVLEEESIGIEEVIAIGYGTIKKSDLTGAVGSVKGEVISERSTTQVSQALQGAMAGVMVTRNNNAPGSSATIRIRGITSIGDSNPLVIVDGVPVGSINDVNPNDIENISVLKDAASASIYGSRAAAGVILVTTKRAKSGDLSLDYNFEYGFEKPTEMAEYVDAIRYMEVVNELRWNDNGNNEGGEFPTYGEDVINNYASLNAENPDLYPNTDWVDLILKDKAPRQSHTIGITAGSKVIKTKVILSYDETDGLYEGRKYERLTARFNNDVTINKYLSASVDFYAKRSLSTNPSREPMYDMRISAPVYAAVWSNGLIAEGKSGNNIYGQYKYGGYKNNWNNQVGGKIALDFIPLEGLKLSAVVSPQFNYNKGKQFLKKVEYTDYDDPNTYVGTLQWSASTKLNESRNDNYNITKQFLINYTKSLSNHNFNLMAGYEDYTAFYEDLGASSDQLELSSYPYLDLGNENFLSNGGNAYENAYRSYFGRVMYNYNNRYFLQGNIRYDGSSRFAKDYRWGAFPSFSAGWVISEESFMQDVPVLSFLKLRASWGSLGNERIGNYPYQSTIGFSSALFYQGNNVISSQTAAQWAYAIKDISWETTESLDIGFDAVLFDNHFHITADYYKKKTKDMLLELEIPDYIGFDNPDQNTGMMDTKGWELELAWNDRVGDFTYSVSANVSDFKSEMGDLGGIQFLGDQVKFEGSEFNEWYGYVSEGIFQTQEEVDNSAVLNSNVAPGDLKYKDISGPDGVPDGIISADYDRQLLGGSLPRYMYGGNIRLGYKNFDLSMVFQGVGKQNVRMNTMMVRPLYENWGSVQQIIDDNYWSVYNTDQQNRSVEYPRLTYNNASNNYAMSDYWMFNGRYVRLKNMTLGYNIPKVVSEKININNIRIYGSFSDIFSLNKYPKGWDPEVSGTGYPITASYIFGVSVKF
ncbi:TonB-dependent receptor [Prolixibacteraceae bacterium Z1-6]|uniref:TonB-dependent receptor n=1 Tax=Draconibacterium aestuarii TaxID=2998507 RepID=A0A9X3J5U8_9BACT|nr:TonB-dependent receptor [Prolixibacteraceae bacterium Z1-6]